ncbi:hypothetical protein AV530_002198 [Patagioenas fasciata monilis]|uniref:Uncharacterized protein n=1 Tax=Patagioenas fasciata monilis TaxID=372326 RepID=A0A1V4K5F5_PATFA|nr:hypothetical protein AV530_002198 [Patagioenas fasciata monilis]
MSRSPRSEFASPSPGVQHLIDTAHNPTQRLGERERRISSPDETPGRVWAECNYPNWNLARALQLLLRTEELASLDTASALWKPTYEFVLQMCQGHTDPTVRSLPEDTELDLRAYFQFFLTTTH